MKKGYWVVAYRSVSDPEKLGAYAALAPAIIAAAGGRFLARGMAVAAYEAGHLHRTVLVEFDSLEKAIACYESPDYAMALAALGNGAERDFRIVEGL